MTTKEHLHQLVDQLPDSKTEAAGQLLEVLAAGDDFEEGMTAEDRAWLESDLSDEGALEPYDWGPAGPPRGNPVRYVPGVGLVVDERTE